MQKPSWWSLDALDQMAVQATAYREVDFTTSLLAPLKPATRYMVLAKVSEAFNELLQKADKEVDAIPEPDHEEESQPL